MTSVTLQLDEALLAKTRAIAERRHSSIDEVVAEALQTATESSIDDEAQGSTEDRVRQFNEIMNRLRGVDLGGPYTRDEMNER